MSRSAVAAALVGLVLAAARANADSGFIPVPLPQAAQPAAPPSTAVREDIERASREVRLALEEQRLGDSGSELEAANWRLRELRALERETRGVPAEHGARVRADLERARRSLELERSAERIERRIGERPRPH